MVYQAVQVREAYIELYLNYSFFIVGVNGLPGQAGLQGAKGERGRFIINIYFKVNI